jgi:hypothetical protein
MENHLHCNLPECGVLSCFCAFAFAGNLIGIPAFRLVRGYPPNWNGSDLGARIVLFFSAEWKAEIRISPLFWIFMLKRFTYRSQTF